MKRAFITNLFFLLCSMILFSCGDNKQQAKPNAPIAVNLYTVEPERAVYHEKFPGTVVALMQVDLRSETEGYVTGMSFTEGGHVRKGQKLYTIDNRKYQATVDQIKANVRVTESNLLQAQKDADRYIYLNQHEAVARQLLDHALTTLENAKSQVAAARQELKRAQADLGYTEVTAPFEGTIGISQVKIGNSVSARQTILNTVSSENPMAVDFVINEKQIARFIDLEQHRNRAADSMFTLQLPDNSVYAFPGTVKFIDRGVNPQTGAITVRLTFPNPTLLLRPGMSCVVRVKNDDTASQLMVPSRAIVEQMGEYFVYTVQDTVVAPGKDKKDAPPGKLLKAVQKKVQTGQVIADRVIIKSGVNAGDVIITDGIQKVTDGALVNPGGKNKETK